ncbi:Stk1 family PASTA domain-containing Ser/Thr kinase [Tindallia californiensis]|uniref:Stk1 family PASTA domain-containing Ser/Thr kinase n=1 Tax=Tindallia californiensis TaxID=159292 RepID=UPI000B8838A7|nr:Stk1 family PASTA domain-containing Ser/Thr kinase [Tindallia californiensis]
MIGTMLGNRYEIIEKLGGGGMAIVYKAKCHLLNRNVAVKILRDELISDKDLVNKFKRESQAVASLSHPNIVNVYDVGEVNDIYYMVMEMVEGKTLKKVIKEKGALHQEEIIYYAKQIARALQHAHENYVIHRDIKPQNILITDDHRAKLTDFGIALSSSTNTLTNTGSLVGSVHYFSPEQARGGYTDAKSDLYSLGIAMYEMATGKLPFEGESPITVALKHLQEEPELPSDINDTVSEGLESIIMKLIEKDQYSRFQNASLLIDALNQLETDPEYILDDFEDEIDENPTHVNGYKEGDELLKMTEQKPFRKKKKTKNSHKTKIVLAAGIITALVAALLFTFGLFYVSNMFRTTEDIDVPDFIGMHLDEAKEKIEELGLQHRVEYQFDRETDEDTVLLQNPSAGMSVRENYPIELTVSTGVETVKVPDLMYEAKDNAVFKIEDAGFIVGDMEYATSDMPSGTVISQEPRAGTEMTQGEVVKIVISEGPEYEMVIMPDLVGSTIESARESLKDLNLPISTVREEHSEEYVEDIVIQQSIVSGRQIPERTSVSLTISAGVESPQIEDIEIEEDIMPEQGENNIEEPRTRTLPIQFDGGSGTVLVELYRVEENSDNTLIFTKNHHIEEDGNSIEVKVTGLGTQAFEIVIDGSVVRTVEISF